MPVAGEGGRRPNAPRKKRTHPKRSTGTGVGPQGLPIQSTSPTRKQGTGTRTKAGPQGLPTQARSPQKPRPSNPKTPLRAVHRQAVRQQRRDLRISGDPPMTAAERRQNDRSVNQVVRQARLDYLRRTHQPVNIGDLVGGFLQHTASKVDVNPGPDLQFAGVGGKNDIANKIVSAAPLAGWNLLRATVEHPGKVASASIRTGIESIAGIPEGVKLLAEDPSKALKSIGQDYSKRYGPLFDNPEKFRRNVASQYGLTPFALDAGASGAIVGRGLGAVARTGRVARVGERLASAPRGTGIRAVGKTVQAANRDRPNLRWTGNAVRRQETSKNLIVAVGQHKVDRFRARSFERKVASGRTLPGIQPGHHEVVPLFGSSRMHGRIAKDIGAQKSRGRLILLRHRDRELGEIRRVTHRLNDDEKAALKYAVQFGLRDAKSARKFLARHLRLIHRHRGKLTPEEVARAIAGSTDEVPTLERILKDPEKFFTPEVAKAADAILQVQRRTEFADPDLPTARATVRRNVQQGELLGIKRGPDVQRVLKALDEAGVRNRKTEGLASLMPDERKVAAKKLTRAAETELERAKQELKRMQGRGEVLSEGLRVGPERSRPTKAYHGTSAHPSVVLAEGLKAGKKGVYMAFLPRTTQNFGSHLYEIDLRKVPKLTKDKLMAHAYVSPNDIPPDAIRYIDKAGDYSGVTIDRLQQEAETALRGQYPQAGAKGIKDAEARIQEAQKAVEQAREVERILKRKRNKVSEPADQFEKRVSAAAKDAGLADPGYYYSSPRPEAGYSEAAIGGGGRATGGAKKYKGTLHRLGMETGGVEPLTRGVERNLKRRFQWALVQRNMETHAFAWSKNDGKGMTASEISAELQRRNIDPETVSYVNPAKLRTDHPHDQMDSANEDIPDEAALRATHKQLQGSIYDSLTDAEKDRIKGVAMNRYLVVPREVGDELLHMSRPEGGFARAWEIAMKQKPARILLAAANIPWLTFQVASNAFLTGLGGGFNPLNIWGAMKMWQGMTPDEQIAWETEIGITRGGHQHIDQRHLGSTKDRYTPIKHIVNFWQAYKHTKVGRYSTAEKVARTVGYGPQTIPRHVMDLMFKADEAQNNFFRKVLFYNQIKRDAYKEMGQNWSRMDREKSKIVAILKKPPNEALHAVMRNQALFEKHAQHVKDFLGNYLEFSDQERRLLSRNVMFYGYLRYSLRFAFYTMPVQHPIMAEIGAEIGRMGSDEIKKLFGVPRTEGLPTRYLGQVYFGDRQDAQSGDLQSINIGRMNPALNQVVGMERLSQSVGLVSPIYGLLAEQVAQESLFTGKDWALSGQPREVTHGRPVTGEERARVALASLLGFAYPYRLAKQTGVPGTSIGPMLGPQGQDSLLWSQRPTEFKSEKVKASIEKSVEADRSRGFGGALKEQLFPLTTPARDIGPQLVQADRERAGKVSSKLTASETAAFRKQIIASGYTPQEADAILRKLGYKK